MTQDGPPAARVPIIEEDARIAKREVASGHVSVRTKVEEHTQVLHDHLYGEALEVRRVPTEREVDVPPPPRQEGDTTIVPLVEERLLVCRKLFVVEELHIRRTSKLEDVSVPVTVRSTRAIVEEDDARQGSEHPSRPAPGSH